MNNRPDPKYVFDLWIETGSLITIGDVLFTQGYVSQHGNKLSPTSCWILAATYIAENPSDARSGVSKILNQELTDEQWKKYVFELVHRLYRNSYSRFRIWARTHGHEFVRSPSS